MATNTKTIIIVLIILTTILIIVRIYFFKSKANVAQFVSESAFSDNRNKQMQMTLQTLEQLRKQQVTPDKELKLEYFFYTNTAEKAQQLAAEIKKLNYTVRYDASNSESDLFVITGWTTNMQMSDKIVQQWVKQMCELGYAFDCDFDGWGTNPDQNNDAGNK